MADVDEFLHHGRKREKTKYLYEPPTIRPNLGKTKKTALPPTHVCKVLLYDNTMQRQMLNVKHNYFGGQQRRVNTMFRKSRHSFADRIRTKQEGHDSWDIKYTNMKDAYINRYGTEYMPTKEEEFAEASRLFPYAKLASPINILCYFLSSGNDPRQKAAFKREMLERKLASLTRDPLYDYLQRRGKPAPGYPPTRERNRDCSGDIRFRSLTESLIIPKGGTDGYLQLSPTYTNQPLPPMTERAKNMHREITLPRFYRRLRGELSEVSRSPTPEPEAEQEEKEAEDAPNEKEDWELWDIPI